MLSRTDTVNVHDKAWLSPGALPPQVDRAAGNFEPHEVYSRQAYPLGSGLHDLLQGSTDRHNQAHDAPGLGGPGLDVSTAHIWILPASPLAPPLPM